MPAFTLVAGVVANYIGAWALGSAGLAFVTSTIALGLAYTTSRLLGLTGGAGGTQQDPGVRIQLPPATQNKVPVVYGHAYQKGVVTDARISDSNKKMTYVLVLSEVTQTGAFTSGDIYWNDEILVFKTAAGSEHIVEAGLDQAGNGDLNSKLNDLIKIRIYSGGATAADQIFPTQATGNTAAAIGFIPPLDPPDSKDADYDMTDLVFAVVELTYSSDNGVTGLPQMTWELTNSLKNPGEVWYDYMTSERYGAAIPITQIDTSTCLSTATTSLLGWSNTIPSNQFTPWPFSTSTTFTSTNQVRYEINGIISTGDTVKSNLDKISQSCAVFTTFDYSQGQWKVILNRAATEGELASAFEFNDDNIIGEVGLTATNLEDLYNILEVEYASRTIRDQNDYFRGAIAQIERNDLEPDNTLNMRLDMVNNAIHAGRIGLIELKQSRVDLIITFKADYSAIQCEAGDVVKVTNDVYGFVDKLFRISKIREVEEETGSITVEITALEYNADVYTDETLEDSAAVPGSGIPTFGGTASLPAPSTPTVTGNATAATPFFTVSTTISSGSLPVDSVDFLISTSSGSGFENLATVQGPFNSGDTVTSPNIAGRASNTYYFRARTNVGVRRSGESASSVAFSWALAPATPSAPFWDTSTSTNVDLFPNASTPHFFIHTVIPGGSITVSSVTFQYSTNSSTGFTSLATVNGPYTAGTDVSSNAITGLSADTYYFRAFSTNNGNNSNSSTSSIALVWNPSPTIDGGVIP